LRKHSSSLKHPIVLVVADIPFIVLALPTFVVRGLLPCLVEINDLLF